MSQGKILLIKEIKESKTFWDDELGSIILAYRVETDEGQKDLRITIEAAHKLRTTPEKLPPFTR